MGAVSLISAIYFLYFQCISILSYNPNQSNANFNIEKKRLAAPASSHRKPLNALRGWEQNLGTGATGDLPSKLGHTSVATMLSTISTVSKILCWCMCNRLNPLQMKLGAWKSVTIQFEDCNCCSGCSSDSFRISFDLAGFWWMCATSSMKYIWIQPNKIENVEGNWYLLLHQIKDIGKNIIFLLTNVNNTFWQNQIGEYVLSQNFGRKYFFILENTTGADLLPLGIKSRETFVKRLLTTSERNRSLIEWAGNRTNERWKKTLSWKICFWDNTNFLLITVKVVDHTAVHWWSDLDLSSPSICKDCGNCRNSFPQSVRTTNQIIAESTFVTFCQFFCFENSPCNVYMWTMNPI